MDKYKFPDIELNEKWFKTYGTAADPARAALQWREWLNSQHWGKASLRKTSASSPDGYGSHRDWDKAKLRKALELAVNVTRASIDNYMSDKWGQLGDDTLQDLDTVAKALGYEPQRKYKPIPKLPKRGARHIALLANLAQLNSPRFRLDVIHSIISEGAQHNFSVALNELPLTEPEMSEAVGQIVRNVHPQGIIWFQLTPSDEALAQSGGVPSAVVHAIKRKYPSPVIGHIVPLQDSIRELVGLWARGLPQRKSPRQVKAKSAGRKVAVAHMPKEVLPAGCESIRNERIRLIIEGLRDVGLEAHEINVEDYSASNAWQVIEQCPDAEGYICLSDEIAISVKHLLWARGEKAAHRILGFDDSSLAERHKVSSIGQHIHDIGRKVCELFETCFRTGEVGFQEVTCEVNLIPRTELDPPNTN